LKVFIITTLIKIHHSIVALGADINKNVEL
jgi:hypothetical protein